LKRSIQTSNLAVNGNFKTVAPLIAIFVVSLVLGNASLSVLKTRADTLNQEEGILIGDSKIWVQDPQRYSQAAIRITNPANEDVTIKKITVEGIECSWDDIYCWKTKMGIVIGELKPAVEELTGDSTRVIVDDQEQVFLQAKEEVALNPKEEIILYVKNPGDFTTNNFSKEATIAVFVDNEVYYQQTKVLVDFSILISV